MGCTWICCSYKRVIDRPIFRCVQRRNPHFTQILPTGWRFYLIGTTLKHHFWYSCKQPLLQTTKTSFIYQSVSIFLSLQSVYIAMVLFCSCWICGWALRGGGVTVREGTIIRWKLCPCDIQYVRLRSNVGQCQPCSYYSGCRMKHYDKITGLRNFILAAWFRVSWLDTGAQFLLWSTNWLKGSNKQVSYLFT